MISRISTGKLVFLLALLAATPALAHVGAGATSGFASGFAHPLLGPDHLLAMVGVGLWAGLVGGSALWVWPAAFIGVMIAGGGMGMAGVPLPFVEPAILASVIAVGAAVALAVRAPVSLGALVVGGFAMFHGHAHGTEIPETAAGVDYLAGFALATATILGVGIAIAIVPARFRMSPALVRSLGAGVAFAGAALAAG
ncbi:HupE/UreJ family protein [Microbaculum sp. FT89]|uniref:HupE/UreJ family protein n=1 Tax=Microbaculum sp. FT89 TaxID=3447298 RepID=UPI003F53D3EC